MATKIFYNDNRIIIDGHADSAEECKAITAMCDSMANDENFKTIVYESGHAVFERVSGGESLKFIQIEALQSQINNLQSQIDSLRASIPAGCGCPDWTNDINDLKDRVSSLEKIKPGMTPEEVETLVESVKAQLEEEIANIRQLTPEEVQAIFDAAIAGIEPGMTQEEVEALVEGVRSDIETWVSGTYGGQIDYLRDDVRDHQREIEKIEGLNNYAFWIGTLIGLILEGPNAALDSVSGKWILNKTIARPDSSRVIEHYLGVAIVNHEGGLYLGYALHLTYSEEGAFLFCTDPTGAILTEVLLYKWAEDSNGNKIGILQDEYKDIYVLYASSYEATKWIEANAKRDTYSLHELKKTVDSLSNTPECRLPITASELATKLGKL